MLKDRLHQLYLAEEAPNYMWPQKLSEAMVGTIKVKVERSGLFFLSRAKFDAMPGSAIMTRPREMTSQSAMPAPNRIGSQGWVLWAPMDQLMSPGWPVILAKYGDLCTARAIRHLPAAFNTYGGWGEGIPDELAEPFFSRLLADERAAARVGHPCKARVFLLQCGDCRGDHGDPPHTAPKLAAAPPSTNTKRGKPHLATPKVGLWDEPPQLAFALAAGF